MGPGKPLFDAIFQAVGKINIIAEDLVCLSRAYNILALKFLLMEFRWICCCHHSCCLDFCLTVPTTKKEMSALMSPMERLLVVW